MAPASIHEVFQVIGPVTIGDQPLLAVLWRARRPRTYGFSNKWQCQARPLFCASKRYELYCSIKYRPLQVGITRLLIVGLSKIVYDFGPEMQHSHSLTEEKLIFITFCLYACYKNVGWHYPIDGAFSVFAGETGRLLTPICQA